MGPFSTEFGHVDFEISPPSSDRCSDDGEAAPPPSTSRVFGATEKGTGKRPTLRKDVMDVHNESTRIFSGDALAASTREPAAAAPVAPVLAVAARRKSPLADDGSTRAWAEVDEALLSFGEHDVSLGGLNGGGLNGGDVAPPSSGTAPSGSGVALQGRDGRDNRVAAMRELYAKGDADGALALAATLGQTMPPPVDGHDSPDASIVVEFSEHSVDLADPFGGLLVDDEESAPPVEPPRETCAAPQLSLTERHSIPRLLKSIGEVSKLKIDHRAGFLLAHVDGMQTLEEILDVCAMPPNEALELIANLKEMGVIEFE